MSSLAERASPARAPLSAFALALVLATFATPSHAQAPNCAWGDGVTLPFSGEWELLIASDGGAGVLALAWRVGASPGLPNKLHMFHVLEQGKLDPSQPDSGVSVLSGADLGSQFQLHALRAIPDGSGGLYILTRTCDAWYPGLRCYEVSEIRLQHVTAQGLPAPGWPTTGHVIPYHAGPSALESVDIVPDGAGGIIVGWLDGTVWNGTYPVMAQRFSAGGTASWPGGSSGFQVLASSSVHASLRIAGDGAGGVVAVVSRRVSATDTRMELVACRVDGSGTLAWGAAGKPVMQQPSYSAEIRGVSVGAAGAAFVTAHLGHISSGPAQFFTQLLTPTGNRAWGLYGVGIGPAGNAPSQQLLLPEGHASLHSDESNVLHLQVQDGSGYAMLGETPAGMPLEWTDPWVTQFPFATSDGNMMLLWSTGGGPDPVDAHALELDASGYAVAGWPETGMPVCGGIDGLNLAAGFEGAGHLFVGFSSSGFYGAQARIQRLSRAVLAADEGLPERSLELAPPSPNPARGAWVVNVALREASRVSLEAFDIAGRRVLARDLGTLSPGRHPLQVAGDALPPGVYRVRARAGGHLAERVLVKIR